MKNYYLSECPEDPICSIDIACFQNNSAFGSENDDCILALTSWDKSVRIYNPQINSKYKSGENHLYETRGNKLPNSLENYFPTGKCVYNISNEQVYLSCKFFNSNTLFLGGFNNGVDIIDINQNSSEPTSIVKHSAPVRCLSIVESHSMVVSGSWDGSVILTDIRANESNSVISKIEVKGKVFCMDHTFSDEWLLVGDSFKNMNIINIKKLSSTVETEKTEVPNFMKYQLRDIDANKHKDVFATSSIEGRVQITTVENALKGEINNKENPIDNYAFKCHRVKDNAKMTEVIYPVNSVCFHKQYSNMLATGGSDGGVFLWDTKAKKRLWRNSNFQIVDSEINPIRICKEGISSMKFHPSLPVLISSCCELFESSFKENTETKDISGKKKSSVIFHSIEGIKPVDS
ncbi:bub3-like protein [Cryptosporidium ryanae]|uniref:bub3-like protein n=1 Tax=Cryptosporidium ryanae TaxID=515981 RepID=UPI00351A2E75|nr:bub3-like protein [Cryptosporidium ryanae]